MDKSAENIQPIKNRETFKTVLEIVFLVLSVLALVVSSLFYYERSYLTPYFVDGQSMYPTFNKDTTDASGNLVGKTGGASGIGYKHIDYIVGDAHKGAIKRLKRFDVVVTYKSDAKNYRLIKRIIGLPGETIKFTSTNSSDPENGDLYVKSGDTFTLVNQPIENEYKVSNDAHPYPKGEITLGENEYFVLGDNRGYSSDSRSFGAIKQDWICAKVIAIAGYCEYAADENGVAVAKDVKYTWPRLVK